VHWDGELPLALKDEDVVLPVTRGFNKRNDVVWYQPSSDLFILFLMNADGGPEVLAFKRGGEFCGPGGNVSQCIVPWKRVIPIRPGVFMFMVNNPSNGKVHPCILDLQRLEDAAKAKGVHLGRWKLDLFTTFGALPPLALSAESLAEMATVIDAETWAVAIAPE
jgi:hypothetical protein